MGTTESTFLDDTSEKSSEDDYRNHRHHNSTTSNDVPASYPAATAAPPLQQQQRRRPPTDPSFVTQHHQQQQPYSSSSSRISHPQSTKNDRLRGVTLMTPVTDESSSETSFLLQGFLVGKARSGKRTLLQRLAGKEPQFTKRRRRQQSTNNTSNNIEMESLQSDEAMIEPVKTRYQPPPPLPPQGDDDHEPALLDASIQLEVNASDKAEHPTVRPHDFYLVLVDPRHDRSKLQKYLTKAVQSALHSQGYRKTATTDPTINSQRRPFCLCLLRNFCDLVSNEEDMETISGSDLVAWTMLVLERYDLDESLLVLQCTNTSLVNCYGLSTLHSFIYQAYLQRKRHDIVRQLSRIDETVIASKRSAPMDVSYERYVQNLAQLMPPPTRGTDASSESQTTTSTTVLGDDSATTATSSGGASPRRSILGLASDPTLPPTPRPTPPQPPVDDNDHATETTIRRGVKAVSLGDSSVPTTLPSAPQQQQLDHAKEVLEAFLGSDSEETDSHEIDDTSGHDGTTAATVPINSNSPPPLTSVVTIPMSAAKSTELPVDENSSISLKHRVKPLSLRHYDSDSESDEEFYINEGVVDLDEDG